MVSDLDRYNADEVLFYAAGLLEEMMGSKDIAIYICNGSDFARLFTATSEKARTLGNSIRMEAISPLMEDISNQRVFINRSLDPGLPMMANGVYRDEQLLMLVMIWSLPWERMTLGEADRLAVICALIQNAVYRAQRYLTVLENQRFLPGTRVLGKEAFLDLIRVHQKADSRGLTEVTLLRMPVSKASLQKQSELVWSRLRGTDYVGTLDDGFLYVLLTNTGASGASVVLQRLADAGIRMNIVPFQEKGDSGVNPS
jgi:hypothetical protein